MENNANYLNWQTQPSMNLGHQARQNPPGYRSNHDGTETHATTLRGPMLPGTSAMSIYSSATSLASNATIPTTVASSRTTLGTSSCASPTVPDTIPLVLPTQSQTTPKQSPMPCVGCWKDFKDLSKHYPYCPYIRGDWVFWASPYFCTVVFHDRDAFTAHIKSFKPDEIHIESAPYDYVSPRTWTTDFREHAMIRQLMNILYEYFRINSQLSYKWQVLNDGDMTPNLDVFDTPDGIREVLFQCSELLRYVPSRVKINSPIPKLKQIFCIQTTEAVAEIVTPPAQLGKRRRNMSVSYTALDSIKPIDKVKVEFGNAGFTGAELALHQRRQLGSWETSQDQRYIGMGGVFQVNPASKTLGSSNMIHAGGMSDAPDSLGHPTQVMNTIPGNFSSNAAEVQYSSHGYPMEDTEVPPLPHFQQATQQEQYALVNPNSKPHANNAVGDIGSWDRYLDWLAQSLQASPQMQNANANTNENMTNAYDNFNDWDSSSQSQVPPTLRQSQDAYVNANASTSNAVDAFNSRSNGVLPEHVQVLQQFHNTNADMNAKALGDFDFGNLGPIPPPYAEPSNTGYLAQQNMGPSLDGYHAF